MAPEREFPILLASPSSPAFGDVTNGQTADIDVTLINDDGVVDLRVFTAVFSNSVFAISPASAVTLPVVIPVDGSVIVTLRFSPDTVQAETGTVTWEHNGLNTPLVGNLTGTGVSAGTIALSVDPSSHDFGTQKTTVATAEKLFTVENTGTVDVIISAVNFAAPFLTGGTTLSLPRTLTPGQTDQFGVIFTPTAEGDITKSAGASVVSDAAASPFDVELTGEGILIVPAFILTGATQAFLLGFFKPSTGVTVVKQADTSDLNCEEAGSFERVHDFGVPGVEKYVARVRFRYEDEGVATVKVQLDSSRDPAVNQSVSIGTAGAGSVLKNAFANIQLTHDLIEVKFSRLADGGPFVMTEYDPRIEPRGEVIEAT
jgi:hypothetical protein